MAIYLEAVEGPYTGQSFSVQEGTEIGRTRGHILLKKDTKVSALHASVTKDAQNNLVLIDQNSSNGLRLKGQKVQRITLLDGVNFILGKSHFQVVERFEAADWKAAEKGWEQILAEEVPSLSLQKRPPRVSVAAFRAPLHLRFLEGIQTDQNLLLGFGPREFGSETLDLELQEEGCPPIAFRISPSPDGQAFFSTDYKHLVHLADRSGKNYPLQNGLMHALQDGDFIRIGETLIQVEFE